MRERTSLDRLAWLLDQALPIPGTGQRIGVDGIIGFIPGVGDTVGALLSTYIIVEAARRGASVWTVVRMLANVAVETIVGAVPVIGDVFDVLWKANLRNLALLGETLEEERPARDPRGVLRVALVLIAVTMIALLATAMLLTAAIWRWLTGP